MKGKGKGEISFVGVREGMDGKRRVRKRDKYEIGSEGRNQERRGGRDGEKSEGLRKGMKGEEKCG